MNESEILEYRESFSGRWNIGLYVQMLEVDGLYSHILKIADEWTNGISDLDKLLNPIAQKYPAACFKIARKNCLAELDNSQGRHLYQKIAQLLKYMATNTGDNPQAVTIARELTKLYSRRSALRDELRKEDLI